MGNKHIAQKGISTSTSSKKVSLPQNFQKHQTISGWFSSQWTRFKNWVGETYDAAKSVVTGVYHKVEDVVTTIHNDIKGAAGSLQQVANHAVDVTGGTITNVSGNLTLPLTIGAVGLGAFLLFSKR